VCDQYTLQGDAFSRAIQGVGEVPVPLENALANMAVIASLFEAGELGKPVALVPPRADIIM
jgi:hypothetical protein